LLWRDGRPDPARASPLREVRIVNAAELLWRTLRREDPSRSALVGSSKTLSWGEVRQRMANLVEDLRRRGVTRGDRVGILSRNVEEYAEAYWAIVSLGGVAVPLNFRLAAPEMRALIGHASPTAYMCSTEMLPNLLEVDPGAAERPLLLWGERDEVEQ